MNNKEGWQLDYDMLISIKENIESKVELDEAPSLEQIELVLLEIKEKLYTEQDLISLINYLRKYEKPFTTLLHLQKKYDQEVISSENILKEYLLSFT